MQDYIVCERRGSHPRIHVKICEHRCEHVETCLNYLNYKKNYVGNGLVPQPAAEVLPSDKGLAPAAP
jgi:hypothetical protein